MALDVKFQKRLGTFRLDVSFTADNEVLALLGASGCGKSMTLKCIAGIETPDTGYIILNGRTLFNSEKRVNLSPQKRRVGYLFQQYALFPHMTVAQNVGVSLRGLDRRAREKAVVEKLKAFRLEGLEHLRPGQLSGGQQQRVALARIFASEPDLLLLDEPLSALDSYLKWQLELEMMDALRDFHGDAVFVSHDRDEAFHLCQSVCVMTEGRTEPKQALSALFCAPNTVGAALLSGCKNISYARRLDNHTVECVDWFVKLHVSADIPTDANWVGIRAHLMRFAQAETENVLQCHVCRVIDNLFTVILMLQPLSGAGLLRLETDKDSWTRLGEPKDVSIYVSPQDVMPLRQSEVKNK